MRHAAQLPTGRFGTTPSLYGMALGLTGAAVLTGLLSWRFGLTSWEGGHCLCQLSIFVLGCWLLPQMSNSPGPVKQAVGILGVTFMILRFLNYIRTALLTSIPSPGYTPMLKGNTLLSYTGYGIFAAEGMLMQVLLRRILSSWICLILGCIQALLFARILWRYDPSAYATAWPMLRSIIATQLSELGPYYLLTHKLVRQAVSHTQIQADGTSRSSSFSVAELSSKSSMSDKTCKGGTPLDAAPETSTEITAGASSSRVFEFLHAPPADTHSAGVSAAAHAPAAGQGRVPCVQGSQRAGATGRRASAAASLAAIHALTNVAYKSQLRATRTVCVKLDTQMRCDNLPPGLPQQLQAALRNSIGQATSLSINDVAVRPGCICITMKVEEQLAPGRDGTCGPIPSLQALNVAQALLPGLQDVLNSGESTPTCKQATVQLDDQGVVCKWRDDGQAWDIQVRPMGSSDSAAGGQPWLGIAAATCLRSAHTHARSSRTTHAAVFHSSFGMLEVLAEVQLWGVNKGAEVEGWTPPAEHLAMEADWPGLQLAAGSAAPLRLLARLAGGYLSTQVLRLVPGRTPEYVTVQVLIQMHEHELIKHHTGGPPSTLLLMDLELWQSEVLLSSSPLLSVPGTSVIRSSSDPQLPSTWWWGAADNTVASALAQVEQCGQSFTLATEQEGAAEAIRTYNLYVQDLAIWLAQVQRKALCSGLCKCAPFDYPGNDSPHAACRLRPPRLATSALRELGRQLLQDAKVLKWSHVQHMVSRQMRGVVQKASTRKSIKGHRDQMLSNIQEVLLGYPCQHDERLYKQHMAVHLSGVLIVASTAIALIGVVWGIRVICRGSLMSISMFLAPSWFFLQAAALGSMLWAGPAQPTTAGQHARRRLAFMFTTLAYCWRSVVHLGTAIWNKPEADDVYTTAFQRPHFWLAMESVLVFSEQVPASVVLPAGLVFGMALFMEYPAVLAGVIRSSGWHPITCALVTLPLVVGVRLVLDMQLRKQLAHRIMPGASNSDLLRAASSKSD